MEKEDALAYFDGDKIPPIIWYKEGATKYVISHEYYHLEEFMELGKKEFFKGVNGNLEEYLVNKLLREKYVYQRILDNLNDYTTNELRHAKNYYLEYLTDITDSGFDIKAEYLVKK